MTNAQAARPGREADRAVALDADQSRVLTALLAMQRQSWEPVSYTHLTLPTNREV